jgi:hypothetical protein
VVLDNRRLVAEREGLLVTAERRLQQASFELSLYLRDGADNPIVPPADRLRDRSFNSSRFLPTPSNSEATSRPPSIYGRN